MPKELESINNRINNMGTYSIERELSSIKDELKSIKIEIIAAQSYYLQNILKLSYAFLVLLMLNAIMLITITVILIKYVALKNHNKNHEN